METISEILKLVYILILRSIRKIFFVLPVKKNRVIFESFSGDAYSCNPKYISEKLKEKYRYLVLSTPTSPLKMDREALYTLMKGCEYNHQL